MNHTTRKMSDIVKEMSEPLLRHPDVAHMLEAVHVALTRGMSGKAPFLA